LAAIEIAITIDLISPLSLTLTPRFTQTPIAMLVTRLAPKRHYRAIGIPNVDASLPAILGATGIGTPTQSYGLFRFTTKVRQ
jgi:hypothetical protein